MAHDVFISHSTKDKLAADAVVAHLERAGIRCWVAPRDIMPGASWPGSIIQAINQCNVMVVVFSSNANRSDHIRREVERAVSRGVGVIPLRIEDVLPQGDLEYFLSSSHWMDAISPPLERHIEALASKLRVLLSLDVATRPTASAPTTLHRPGPRAEPPNTADDKKPAKEITAKIRFLALYPVRYFRRSIPNLLSWIASEMWSARSNNANHQTQRSGATRTLTSESPTNDESFGRRILRGTICFALSGPVGALLLFICYRIVSDVVSQGENAHVFQSDPLLLLAYIMCSLVLVLIGYYSWRRRPWAIVLGAIPSSVPPLLVFANFAFQIVSEFGSPFSDFDFVFALVAPFLAGLSCLPMFAFAVLAVMEHEPESTWLRSLWRPIVSRRPRWLRWFRVVFAAASCLVVTVGATHATVAEIRRRTPLNYSENKLMGSSWKVVDNTDQPNSGSFTHTHGRGDISIVWTFSRGRRVKNGKVDDSFLQFHESFDFLADNPSIERWSVDVSHKLILGRLRSGTVEAAYTIEEIDKDIIRLVAVDNPKSTILLQRIGRIPFGRE